MKEYNALKISGGLFHPPDMYIEEILCEILTNT